MGCRGPESQQPVRVWTGGGWAATEPGTLGSATRLRASCVPWGRPQDFSPSLLTRDHPTLAGQPQGSEERVWVEGLQPGAEGLLRGQVRRGPSPARGTTT